MWIEQLTFFSEVDERNGFDFSGETMTFNHFSIKN